MKLQIKQRDRWALILLVLASLLYEVANLVVLPAYDRLASSRDLAAEKETQLKRYRRAQLRKTEYADLLKTAASRIGQSESVTISKTSFPLASAEFQSLIEETANKVGVVFGQRTIGTAKRQNEFYAELPLTLTFDSTPGQLVSFLNELRNVPRFLTVRSLQISPLETVIEAPKGAGLTKNLRVAMTVLALASADVVKAEGGAK